MDQTGRDIYCCMSRTSRCSKAPFPVMPIFCPRPFDDDDDDDAMIDGDDDDDAMIDGDDDDDDKAVLRG